MVTNNTGTCVPQLAYLSLRVVKVGRDSDDSVFCFGSQVIFCNKRVRDDAEVRKRLGISPLEFVGFIPAVSFIFIRTKAPA